MSDGVWRWLRANASGTAAAALVALGVLLRGVLTALGWLPVDSDESVFGLMALHIAFRGEHPIWYYGQAYMGGFEAYLAAAAFRLFGISVFTLRLGQLLLFAVFLTSMYLLASRLYSQRLALLTLALLSLGSAEIMVREVETSGHYDVLPFGATLLLLSVWLAQTGERRTSARQRRWRTLACAAWGLLAGLGLWSDLLILPFVLTSGLLLAVFCWREVRTVRLAGLVVGLLAGASPVIAYNWARPPGQGTLRAILSIQHATVPGQAAGLALLTQQLAGTLIVSLPLATGARTLCPLSAHGAWPLAAHASLHPPLCAAAYAGWALGFLALWAVSGLLAVRWLWRGWRAHGRRGTRAWAPDERREAVRHAGRLMLVASAGLVLGLYALSAAPVLAPWTNERYLMGLLIAFPAAIAPLERVTMLRGASRWPAPSAAHMGGHGFGTWSARGAGYAALAWLGIVLLFGTVRVFDEVPGARQVVHQQQQLNGTLGRLGATRIYADYWTCNRITFQTRERIICAVLDDDLRPGQDRYQLYPALVKAAARPAYVFPLASPQAGALARLAVRPGAHYRRFVLDGYVIYWPTSGSATDRGP